MAKSIPSLEEAFLAEKARRRDLQFAGGRFCILHVVVDAMCADLLQVSAGGVIALKHHFTRKELQQEPISPWGRSVSPNIHKLWVCKELREISYCGPRERSLRHGLFSKEGIEKMFELRGGIRR